MTKFRFHWGWAIGVFYSLFVITMIAVVIRSFTVDNSLVVEDYYKYDITYQEHSDKLANNRSLKQDLVFDHDRSNKKFSITYPAEFSGFSGTILFYKPDNKKLDFELPVRPDSSRIQTIDLSSRGMGYWRIKIDWNGDDTAFYKEHSLFN
jgi:hypothetical protein